MNNTIKVLSRGPTIDTEKCVKNLHGGRFELVLIAAARAREIRRQNSESLAREHVFPNITALLEVQEGKIGLEYIRKVR